MINNSKRLQNHLLLKKQLQQTRNVFIYWVGKEYSLISLFRDLIRLHSTNGNGYRVILINHNNIHKYIFRIPRYFYKLCPAHQADFVRVNVVCDYGGIWLDSDILVMDSLDPLFSMIENNNGFFIRENNEPLFNGIFGSKPYTPIMRRWKYVMNHILNKKRETIYWTEIGNDLLTKLYDLDPQLYSGYKIWNGLDNIYPVNWDQGIREYIEKPYENYKNIIRNDQFLIVLNNSVYKKLEDKSPTEILESNLVLNYFINTSLKNTKNINFRNISDCTIQYYEKNKEK